MSLWIKTLSMVVFLVLSGIVKADATIVSWITAFDPNYRNQIYSPQNPLFSGDEAPAFQGRLDEYRNDNGDFTEAHLHGFLQGRDNPANRWRVDIWYDATTNHREAHPFFNDFIQARYYYVRNGPSLLTGLGLNTGNTIHLAKYNTDIPFGVGFRQNQNPNYVYGFDWMRYSIDVGGQGDPFIDPSLNPLDFYLPADPTLVLKPVSQPIPEPATILLLGSGLLGLALKRGKKRSR